MGDVDIDGPCDEVGPDTLHRLLADSRRRVVLEALAARGAPIGVENLARAVVARERGTVPPAVSADEAREGAVSLYHDHLPDLDEHGVVEFDSANDAVATGAAFGDVASGIDEDGE